MNTNNEDEIIDWHGLEQTFEQWKKQKFSSTPYFDMIINTAREILDNFDIINDYFSNETIKSAEKLIKLVLDDLYNEIIGRKSKIKNELSDFFPKFLFGSNVLEEMLEEIYLFVVLIQKRVFEEDELSHQIQSKYLFHSLYSKIDIIRYKHQSMYSLLNYNEEIDDEKILEKIVKQRVTRGTLNYYEGNGKKFVKKNDPFTNKNLKMLNIIAKIRNQEAHNITDTEKRRFLAMEDGKLSSFGANYKAVPTWLIFSFVLLYLEDYNIAAYNEYKQRPKEFERFINRGLKSHFKFKI